MNTTTDRSQHHQQNLKTKQFWDCFYSDLHSHAPKRSPSAGDSFEWILATSSILLDELISSIFPMKLQSSDANDTLQLNILEIGCGVSELSRCLLARLMKKRALCHELVSFRFLVTDISEVCIEQNRQRDTSFISLLKNNHNTRNTNTEIMYSASINDSLQYEIMDILTTEPTQLHDIILDKGVLDTFLFRSKRTSKGSELYPPLMIPLLNNIHSWLRNKGKYIIISPRGKIKAVRDYNGFSCVKRMVLDVNKLGGSILLESNATDEGGCKKNVYIYECQRNDGYDPKTDAPFGGAGTAVHDESTCPKCQQSFKEFRGKVKIEHQGKVVWERKWNNHMFHCKG